MAAEFIGAAFLAARERVGRLLVRLGVRPDHLTILGLLFTVGAGACIAAGPAYWRPWAVVLLVLSGACDILDGGVAKIGNLATRWGGILDSCCDRVGDFGLYGGLALYFGRWPGATGDGPREPNLTLMVLAFLGLLWAYLISYIRARAENTVPACGGGFWQRGERIVTFLVGLVFLHATTIVWILGLWPIATVAHRLWRARRAARLVDAGQGDAARDLEPRGLAGLVLWRWGRRGVAFDLHIAVPVLMLALWDIPATVDPLREWLRVIHS